MASSSQTFLEELSSDNFDIVYCDADNKGNIITTSNPGIKFTRDDCDKIASEPEIINPDPLTIFTTPQNLNIKDRFTINGRVFAPVAGKDNTFICIARKSNTQQLMVGFSSSLNADTIKKSIVELISSQDSCNSVQISQWHIIYNSTTRKLSVKGPIGEPKTLISKICGVFNDAMG